MVNINNNFNVIPWYLALEQQNHRKWYAFDKHWPLIMPNTRFLPFQFVLDTTPTNISTITVYSEDKSIIRDLGITPIAAPNAEKGYCVVMLYPEICDFTAALPDGRYYATLTIDDKTLYSEVFTVVDNISSYLKLTYWNTDTLYYKNGEINYANDFRYEMYLDTTIGKPEYEFSEELTTRLGYKFLESQISNKLYKFVFLGPEFICDAMRLIRLSDYIKLESGRDSYNAISFSYEPSWETQGDLASIEVSFETDTIIQKLPSFNRNQRENFYNALLSSASEPLLFDEGVVAQYYTAFSDAITGKLTRQLAEANVEEITEATMIPIDQGLGAAQRISLLALFERYGGAGNSGRYVNLDTAQEVGGIKTFIDKTIFKKDINVYGDAVVGGEVVAIAGEGTPAGVTDYSALTGKPSINGKELASGENTLTELGIQPAGDYITESLLNTKLDNYATKTFVSNNYAGKSALNDHIADSVRHITDAERTAWNNKSDLTAEDVKGIKVDNAGHADSADNATKAGSADKLTNSRKIFGLPFNGTKDVDGGITANGDSVIKGNLNVTKDGIFGGEVSGIVGEGTPAGVTDYSALTGKPSINGKELASGDNSLDALGIQPKGDYTTASQLASTLENYATKVFVSNNYATKAAVNTIQALIPATASADNQLADKDFVNSSIATATAEFKGSFTSLDELKATSGNLNDYAFYLHTDSVGNSIVDRYKWTTAGWLYEYTLNNSSFTAEQWAALNSAITKTLVQSYNSHLKDSTIHITAAERTKWNNKWDYNEETIKGVKVNAALLADKATKLQTARTIWGQPFDGTGNVSGNIQSSNFQIVDLAGNPYLRLIQSSTNYYVQTARNILHLGKTFGNGLHINESGYLGVNTESPQYTLDVNGNGHFASKLSVDDDIICGGEVAAIVGEGTPAGVTDYSALTGKPSINGVTLVSGNNTLAALGIQAAGDYATNSGVTTLLANYADKTFVSNNYVGKSAFNNHTADTDIHITAAERDAWNAKWDYNEATIKAVKVTSASSADSVAWSGITGKPTTFTPSAHTHTASEVSGLPTSLKNPYAVEIKANGVSLGTYDGSTAATFNLSAANVGAANKVHTHTASEISGLPTKLSAFTNDVGFITGITKSMVEGVLTGDITSHTHSYLPLSGGTLTGRLVCDHDISNPSNYTWRNSRQHSGEGGRADPFIVLLKADSAFNASFGTYGDGETDSYIYIGYKAYNDLNLRIGATSISWGDNRILHAGNYNSYSPTLTGTGASGTWGINISGNAASATKLATARTIWGQSFDGSADVSGDLINVGNITTSGKATIQGDIVCGGEVASIVGEGTPAGVTDYSALTGKPSINGVTLVSGNNTLVSLGIQAAGDYATNSGVTTLLANYADKTFVSNNYVGKSAFNNHTADTNIHITAAERVAWNAKWDYDEATIKAVKVTSASSADSVAWTGISGKPTTFTPSAHTHTASDISGLPTKLSAFTNDVGYITGITKPMVEGVLTGDITSHTHSYLSLMGGTLTGSMTLPNVYITGTNSKLPSHCFHYLYEGNSVYEHFGEESDRYKVTYGNFRFFNGSGSYKTMYIGGDGSFSWDGSNVLTASNYNSYAPTLTGTGASGTWGINISGNAATATNAGDADTLDGYHSYAFRKDWTTLAGGDYVGWVRIMKWTTTTAGAFSPQPFLLSLRREYSSPATETYTLSFTFGWKSANIVQLNGNGGVRIIEKFRISKTADQLTYYLEYYVNPTYSTYANVCYCIISSCYNFGSVELINEVASEDTSTLHEITTKLNSIVGNIEGNASSATKLQTSGGVICATTDGSGNVTFSNEIFISTGKAVRMADSSGVYQNAMFVVGSTLNVGYDSPSINIGGKIYINSSGNATIGASDLASTTTKLYVNGTGHYAGDLIVDGEVSALVA